MQPDKVHEIISEKYDKLLWAIAHKISGDRSTASLEDNYADLWLAVFEAIEGFTKQNDYSNGPVEEWIETKPFDKYLKTCLWNKKNHKGKQIANKYKIHRDTVPTDLEEVLNVCCPGISYAYHQSHLFFDSFGDFHVILTQEEQEVMTCLLNEPNQFITEGGKVKILPFQKVLGWDRKKVASILAAIKKKMLKGLE